MLDDVARAVRLIRDVQAAGPLPATSRLADGTVGYHQTRTDDCWRAAVATCIQIPIGKLPDARIDEHLAAGESVKAVDRAAWTQMTRWLDRRGWSLIEHPEPPTYLERWIGIVPVAQPLMSHCLIMRGDRILFDPAVAPGVRTFYPLEVAYGFSFQAKE